MVRAAAPGRVNLIGEHTDYNDGLVLPAVIALRTIVDLAGRADSVAHVESDGFGGARYAVGEERPAGDWTDHIRGVTWALAGAGHRIGGFDARVRTTIPAGAGLASSAALAVALLRALRTEFLLSLDDTALALVAHRAESEFVGARVGRMDQLAASLGRDGEALLIDMRTLAIDAVPIPAGIALVVVDSGIAHAHARGGYNARRAECEAAAHVLGLRSLRDASGADLERLAHGHAELVPRARHVLRENERVRAFVGALRSADPVTCGTLLDASHASLRDDFAVSLPEIDLLAEVLRGEPGVYGARLIGGGFGGAVLALARPDAAAEAARAAAATYRARTGGRPRVLVA